MAHSTTYPAPDIASLNIRIAYRDEHPSEELCGAAERSVGALVLRHMEATRLRREAEAVIDEAAVAYAAPATRLVEPDPAAAEVLRTARLLDGSTDSFDRYATLEPTVPEAPAWARQIPPYHYTWSWHDTNGYAPYGVVTTLSSGALGLDARSGSLPGGKSGFVNAHAGFGLAVTTDHEVMARGVSFRQMRYSYTLAAAGTGGNATSEGGMEFTAFEDGNLIGATDLNLDKLWRSRVSTTLFDPYESDSGGQGPYAVDRPLDLYFRMRPGHGYTFNVGGWVASDYHSGAGQAGAQAFMQGAVLALTVWK
ncbi:MULTISPECIES: hypothetical protein [unclassified Streptomyces]|uniref:hypothetical protein n=1 Tax=unclassified Streptomyces TaxID=2593676 RepID=UPI002E321090|nr:hypothetical protein [Streptomyces sp. NBC_01268]